MNRPSDRVVVQRLVNAPVDEVFAAWTDAGSLATWMSPNGRAEVEADVRVGGRFRVVMLGEQMQIEHTGEYLHLEPPRKLSFTWRSAYTGEGASVVTVTLRAQGDVTLLVLVHERLPEDTAASHETGWTSILANLASKVEA